MLSDMRLRLLIVFRFWRTKLGAIILIQPVGVPWYAWKSVRAGASSTSLQTYPFLVPRSGIMVSQAFSTEVELFRLNKAGNNNRNTTVGLAITLSVLG